MKYLGSEIAIIGAGMAGIATAFYLSRNRSRSISLVDCRQPMSLTSSQSGDNYRNWWPHPVIVDFTNHSIDLMERIARNSGNILQMTRRGYALATRQENVDNLLWALSAGFGPANQKEVRIHESETAPNYIVPDSTDWALSPEGVDVLSNRDLIKFAFPYFDPAISHVVHVRRAGDIVGQQLGQYMLEYLRENGGALVRGEVCAVDHGSRYCLTINGDGETTKLTVDILVNAAGPFAGKIGGLLDVRLPITNVLQQKIAFPDTENVISRQMPFAADLDGRTLDWSDEERELLLSEDGTAWLGHHILGAIHCRPEGGEHSNWLKLGWAINQTPEEPRWEPDVDPHFPEIVLRGASGLNPNLKTYYGRFPSRMHHYGGYYTMTEENIPLIGPHGLDGAFLVGALSGFGSMSACAAGELCARWIDQKDLPDYANVLSLKRYDDPDLVEELAAAGKGIL